MTESSAELSAVPLNSSQGNERVALSSAMEELEIYFNEGLLSKNNMTIHFVTGDDVDQSGMARIWTLGVCQNNIPSLYTYNNGGWRQTGWDGAFTDKAIDPDAILSPSQIYEMNAITIRNIISSSGLTDTHLELAENVYSVIARSDSKIFKLKFDAFTGEMI